MSTPNATAASAPPDTAKPKGKGKLIIAAVGVVALGGGGAYAMLSGLVPGMGGGAPAIDENQPQLQYEEGSSHANPRFVTSYAKIEGAFTTNLAGGARFVQIELGIATRYDARVVERVLKHDLPIRSAVLGVLAQQSEDAVSTPAGRAALQRALKAEINRVLTEKEGFGGVDDVYFAGLVVQ